MKIMVNQIYKCPLCESLLTREKWVKITGQWEEIEREKTNIRKLLDKATKEREELQKKHQVEMRKLAKQAEVSGIEKGIKKEKAEREKMSQLIQNQTKAIIASNKRIQELEKLLKEGKTPQTAGFDYENEVFGMLSESFPEDRLQATGKKGDVIQFIIVNGNEIGSILYECKKTEKYSNQFIKEIKRHQELAKANHAVVVTHALKENKSKFFVEEDVVVIDPLGLLDVAYFLRTSVVDIHKMKLTQEKAKEKGMQILRYMQSGEFKNNMVDNIEKSRQAYELLLKEVKDHQKDWIERIKIYSAIHDNTQNVRKAIGEIIIGGPVELERYTFAQIGVSEIQRLESGS